MNFQVLVLLKIDDPVGAISVHLAAGLLSTLFVGTNGQNFFGQLNGNRGLFYGGSFQLLWIQVRGLLATAVGFFAVQSVIPKLH